MNGRVYDPLTAQFFSPDPYVQAPNNWLNYNRYTYCYGNPFKYTDPSGEYFIVDDIVGAVISGVVNVVTNLGNIHSFGQGLSYFGVGASGYIISEYASPVVGGMYMSAANNVLSQGFANGFKNIEFSQTLSSGIMGGLTAQMGQYIGKFVGPEMGKFASTITKSPVIQQAITQSTTNAIGGFAIGTGFSLANGKSFDDALASGEQGALMGFGIGAVNGVVSGIQYSHKYNVNPWTGKTVYPSNAGFNSGTQYNTQANSGDRLVHFGDVGNSRYLTTSDTNPEQLSLPPENNLTRHEYVVKYPFNMTGGTAAPWFNQIGGGAQYMSTVPIKWLQTNGYIAPLH